VTITLAGQTGKQLQDATSARRRSRARWRDAGLTLRLARVAGSRWEEIPAYCPTMNRVMQVVAVLVFIIILAGVYDWVESLF
jgi:hypothetical protein